MERALCCVNSHAYECLAAADTNPFSKGREIALAEADKRNLFSVTGAELMSLHRGFAWTSHPRRVALSEVGAAATGSPPTTTAPTSSVHIIVINVHPADGLSNCHP